MADDGLTIWTGNFKLANNTSFVELDLEVGVVGGDKFKLYRIASSVNGDDVLDDVELGIRRLRRENTLSWSGAALFVRELRSRLKLLFPTPNFI